MNTESVVNPEQKINDWAETNEITAKFEFVPFSLSRNAGEKYPSLNWKVTLHCKGREFLRVDYMQGSGHAPSYKHTAILSPWEKAETIKKECETGKMQRWSHDMGIHIPGPKIAPPKLADVLHSLSIDSDALNYATFEEWASEFGYDKDSRKGEAIYRACMEIALKLRAAVGDKAIAALRDATQDY